MRKLLLLAVAAFSWVSSGTGADTNTNLVTIGNETVVGKWVDGKLIADRYFVESNTLYQITFAFTPLPGSSNRLEANPISATNGEGRLQLLFTTGTGNGPAKFGGPKGLHGFIYMARDWATPNIAQSNLVDIYSSEDNTKIVMMVLPNGPVYSSTNSGMAWAVVNAPGRYDFPFETSSSGEGFFAEAIIHRSPETPNAANPPAVNWYAVGSANDGSKMALTANVSQPSPALSVRRSSAGVVVSWSAAFAEYVLQENGDLFTTNWIDVAEPVSKAGDVNQVIISIPTRNCFYRLKSR